MTNLDASCDAIRVDVTRLEKALKQAQLPGKLLASIKRKCLLTPRRQTGRAEHRTNRESRWKLASSHPDYSSERDALLIYMTLLLQIVHMENGPRIDASLVQDLATKHGINLLGGTTTDPLTEEVLSYNDLVADVVSKPKHGFSKFHIGHQNPKLTPKHQHGNIRWQLKTSNDFQATMTADVARIAFALNRLCQQPTKKTAAKVDQLIDALKKKLGL